MKLAKASKSSLFSVGSMVDDKTLGDALSRIKISVGSLVIDVVRYVR